MINIMDEEYGAGLRKKVHIRAITRAKEKQQVKLTPLCRAYGITREGYYQAMRRIDAWNKALEPVMELVMYWRQFIPRIGGKKLYLMIKPELQERDIKLGRDCFFLTI